MSTEETLFVVGMTLAVGGFIGALISHAIAEWRRPRHGPITGLTVDGVIDRVVAELRGDRR